MSLSDPFNTTYQGSFQAGQSLGQGIQSAAGSVSDVMKQKNALEQQAKQRQQGFQTLQSLGLVKQNSPTNDDLAKGLEDYGTKAGVSVNVNHGDNPDIERKNMMAIYKAMGIPMPKGSIDVMPGTSIDMGGGVSYTAPKQEKSVAQQVQDVTDAKNLLDSTPGMSGNTASETGGKLSIKPQGGGKSGFGALSPENAKAAADRIVSGSDNPMQYSKYAWGSIAPYLPKDYNAAKASADYSIAESGGKKFEGLYNTMSMAEDRYNLNRKVAMNVAKKINSKNAPILQKALLTGNRDFGGDKDAADIFAAINTVSNEYAKLTTNNGMNGNLTDTASQKASDIISAALTEGQIDSLIGDDGVMTKDANNAMDALNDTKSEIEKRLVQSSKSGPQGVLGAAGMGGQSQNSKDPLGIL